MDYGPRYQRMMAERRQKQEERERELRAQEDALLHSMDPASVIDDPSQNENEEAKEELLQKVQSERKENQPQSRPQIRPGLPGSGKSRAAFRRHKEGREYRKSV